MKISIKSTKQILIFTILFITSNLGTAQNPQIHIEIDEQEVYQYDLGYVLMGETFDFTFNVVQFYPKYVSYSISTTFEDWGYPLEWYNISPENFIIDMFEDEKEIQFSGTLNYDLTEGYKEILIEVTDGAVPIANHAYLTVSYNIIGGIGVNDWIEITDCTDSFSEGDWVNFEAVFHDVDEPDEIDEWTITISLPHSNGNYIFYADTENGDSLVYWSFSAPIISDDLIYHRNDMGQVFGIVNIVGTDTDGYEHSENCYVGINAEPNPPKFDLIRQSENSAIIDILNPIEGNEFTLYYGNSPGAPYAGTGLSVGDSPVNIGDSQTILINEFIECENYFFAIKASNQFGESNYSVEKSTNLFPLNNSEPLVYHDYDIQINSDYSFLGNHFLTGDLIIESGANPVFLGGTILFDESSKIIIEPGGKLTVNGATLTGVCDETWQGIEVWGDSVAQLPDSEGNYPQGFLELKNGALVENTTHGIELWHPDHWGTTGGIIVADSTTFRNNSKSIHALYYHNTNPFNPNSELDYFGRFKNCTFEITPTYHGKAIFYKHIDLDNVKGFRFEGCDFSVDPAAQGVSLYTSGIFASEAGFSATAYCTSQSTPCSAYDNCTFNGFNNAIHAAAGSSIYTFNVERAVFTNNNCGIKAEAVNNFSVLWSVFNIGHNTTDQDDCDGIGMMASGYGINANASTGFAIEENYFTKDTGVPQGYYTGIRVAETSAVDEIYNNQFNGLSYGIYAEGKNWRDSYYREGLSHLCNQFTGSYRDIVVEPNISGQGGIQSSQGSALQPTGNEFVANTGDYKIYNNGNYPILYYYDVNSNSGNPNPSFEVGPIGTANTNNCSSHFGGSIESVILTDEEKLAVEQEYLTALNDYNNVKTLYDNLQDGGDTEGLKAEVESAWPNETWELRAELLGKSPHLSTEVLKAAADKTEVLPESILFEILVANPDELRNAALINYLEEKENPLPPYMINILRQVAYGVTYKTALQNQMAENNRLKTRAANDMIRSILNQDETDLNALRTWLNNRDGIIAVRQIIETYLAEGNVDVALSLAVAIPQHYQLSDYDLGEHAYYLALLDLRIDLLQQGRNYNDLTDVEVTQLENLAQNSYGAVGAQARSILEQSYGHHFCNCLNISDNQGLKSTAVNPALLNQALGVSCTAEPNPAREWTAFDYTLPETAGKGTIRISDATGRVVKVVEVVGTQGQYVWDTREVKPGVYFYTFVVSGSGTTSKLVITK
jgi:hypothetical protein